MVKQKEIITIAIWRKDHQVLVDMCKKSDDFRDKFHEIILKIKKEENKK